MATAARTRTAVMAVRNAAAEERTAAAGQARPPTAPWAAASRGPDPVTGSPRSAMAPPSRRPRRRRRTGPAPPARAAHTTGTSEPRSLPILCQPGRPSRGVRQGTAAVITGHRSPALVPASFTPPSVPAAGRQSAAQTAEFTALRIVMIAFGAQHARSSKNRRQPQSAPSCKPTRPGPECHANHMPRHRNVSRKWRCGAPTCPAIPPLPRRPLRQWRPRPARAGRHLPPAGAAQRVKAGRSLRNRHGHRPGVGLRPGEGLPCQRVRGTPSRRFLPRVPKGRVGD